MSNFKAVGFFVLKAFCFTVIFWSSWIYVLRPIMYTPQGNDSSNQGNPTNAQLEVYEEQVKRFNEQQDISDEQLMRESKLLALREEQARRYNLLLEKWEKQAGLK